MDNIINDINKYIKSKEINTTQQIYNKPEFFWCLNEDIKDILEILIPVLEVELELKKFKKIQIIDLFSGSSIFSLNVIKNLINKEINIENIILNDIINDEDNIFFKKIKEIHNSNDITKNIQYKNIKIEKDIEETFKNFKDIFSRENDVLNLVLCNPLIGNNGFNKYYKNNPKDFIVNKISNFVSSNFKNNSMLFFISTQNINLEEKIEEQQTNKKEEEKEISFYKQFYIENTQISLNCLNEQEKKELIIKENIFKETIKINDYLIKNNNKYNFLINVFFDNEKSLRIYYFNGKEIIDEETKKEIITNIKSEAKLEKDLSSILKKFDCLKKEL